MMGGGAAAVAPWREAPPLLVLTARADNKTLRRGRQIRRYQAANNRIAANRQTQSARAQFADGQS